MPKQTEDPVTGEDGYEHHPAFGIARFNRVHSNPGAVLFQSDLRHGEYIKVTVSEAERERRDGHDWVHATRTLLQFDMSMSQFASFISSGGTEGVPVTISYDHGGRPGLTMDSRLARTSAEVHAAAEKAFREIREAKEAYEQAVDNKEPAAFRKLAWARLSAAIRNATPNVDYASTQLARHAEEVVEKSRADVEAIVAAAQARQGITGEILGITAGGDDDA